MKLGARVEVMSGNHQESLGKATFVGPATVYAMRLRSGELASLRDAEELPSLDLLAEYEGTLETITGNPKFRLDSGRFVYGCQIWWAPIPDEPGPFIVVGGRHPGEDKQIGPEYATRREAYAACLSLWGENNYEVAHMEVRRAE